MKDESSPQSLVPVTIGLGSNVGDSLQNLQTAVRLLKSRLDVQAVSSVYRTAPMYVEDQPPFLNAAIIACTTLGPRSLLQFLKGTEAEIGRGRGERYGPREIDLDLIAYGALRYSFTSEEKALVVPHPKVSERRFVLLPLFEIASELKLVGLGRVRDLLDQTISQAPGVQKIDNAEL